MSLRTENRERVAVWYALMVNAYLHLGEAERAELRSWEAVTGRRTSEWPGWGRHIDLSLFWPWGAR